MGPLAVDQEFHIQTPSLLPISPRPQNLGFYFFVAVLGSGVPPWRSWTSCDQFCTSQFPKPWPEARFGPFLSFQTISGLSESSNSQLFLKKSTPHDLSGQTALWKMFLHWSSLYEGFMKKNPTRIDNPWLSLVFSTFPKELDSFFEKPVLHFKPSEVSFSAIMCLGSLDPGIPGSWDFLTFDFSLLTFEN